MILKRFVLTKKTNSLSSVSVTYEKRRTHVHCRFNAHKRFVRHTLGTISAGNHLFLNNSVLYPYSSSQWSRLFKGDHIHINFLTFFFDLTEPADRYLCRRSIWRMDSRSFQGTLLHIALCYLRHYVTTW